MIKNLFKLMAAFVALFVVAACETETPAPTPNEPEQPETPVSGELATPQLRVEELKESSFTIVWDSVPGADHYTVVLKQDIKQITETSVTYTDLPVGEYAVRVKAVAPKGTELKDSAYATISVTVSGVTNVDWFEQMLYTDTNEAEGIYPYNALCVEWKGVGVKSIRYGLFETNTIKNMSMDNIKKQLNKFDNEAEVLAELNDKGVSFYFTDLLGDTKYTMMTLVTNNEGLEFMARTDHETEVAVASPEAAKWIGKWNVTSDKTITFDSQGKATLNNGSETFTVTISASRQSSEALTIAGLSSYGETWTANTLLAGDTLYIMNGEIIGKNEDNGYDYIWLVYCSIDGKLGQFFNSQIPSYVLEMDASGAVSCTRFADDATFSDGSKKRVEVVHTEVYAQDPTTGDIYFLSNSINTFRAGDMQWVRAN